MSDERNTAQNLSFRKNMTKKLSSILSSPAAIAELRIAPTSKAVAVVKKDDD